MGGGWKGGRGEKESVDGLYRCVGIRRVGGQPCESLTYCRIQRCKLEVGPKGERLFAEEREADPYDR